MTSNTSAARFTGIAANYASSEVHRSSPTMATAHELLELQEGADVVDIACGAGHFGLSFLPNCPGRLVFVDPSEAMLGHVREALAVEDLAGTEVETVCAQAETLPLPDASFDVVLSRLAPHHFSDIQGAVREMTRLLRPGGRLVVIDLEGNEDPELDALNHELEMLHDPTHVRSYTRREWINFLQSAGLNVPVARGTQSERPSGVPLQRWCSIAGSGDAAEAEIHRRLTESDPKQRLKLGIREKRGEFLMPVRTVIVVGVKPLGDL